MFISVKRKIVAYRSALQPKPRNVCLIGHVSELGEELFLKVYSICQNLTKTSFIFSDSVVSRIRFRNLKLVSRNTNRWFH